MALLALCVKDNSISLQEESVVVCLITYFVLLEKARIGSYMNYCEIDKYIRFIFLIFGIVLEMPKIRKIQTQNKRIS